MILEESSLLFSPHPLTKRRLLYELKDVFTPSQDARVRTYVWPHPRARYPIFGYIVVILCHSKSFNGILENRLIEDMYVRAWAPEVWCAHITCTKESQFLTLFSASQAYNNITVKQHFSMLRLKGILDELLFIPYCSKHTSFAVIIKYDFVNVTIENFVINKHDTY